MIIELDRDLKIEDLEEEFSLLYPHLKIELEPIAGLQEIGRHRTVEINSRMTLSEVRGLFRDELHVFVNFFRKQNGEWVEIIDSNGLSLKQENELGKSGVGDTEYKDFLETEY